MMVRNTLSKWLAGAIFAGVLAIGGGGNAALAQTVTTEFSIQNLFGATIFLNSASCVPSTSFFPPASIANNTTATFSASITGSSTLLCTVRYASGSDGCQFAVDVFVSGGTPSGFTQANAFEGSGGRPSCTKLNNNGVAVGSNGWFGSFLMK